MAGASTADMFYLGRKSAHLGSIEPYHPWGHVWGWESLILLRAEAAHIDHNMPGIFSFAVLKPRITPLAPGSVCRGVGVKSAKELSIAMPTGVLVQFTDEEPKSQTPTTLHPRRHLRQPTWTLNC